MIYLASPYSDPDTDVMEDRFNAVCINAGRLMIEGNNVYSPIVHNHPIATRVNMPRGWEFWEEHDLHALERCSELWVLMLDGWDKSKGVAREIKYAIENNKPIIYIQSQ